MRKKIRRGRQKPVSSDNPRDSSNFTLPGMWVHLCRVGYRFKFYRIQDPKESDQLVENGHSMTPLKDLTVWYEYDLYLPT